MRLPFLLAFAMIACTACIPFRSYDTPGLSGNILEAASSAPIAGARVAVTSLQKPALISTATSDANGHFHVEETWHNVWLLPLPYDPIYPDAALATSAPGYKSLQTAFSKLQKPDNQTNFIIRLDRDNS
jgi:hypothetical protein